MRIVVLLNLTILLCTTPARGQITSSLFPDTDTSQVVRFSGIGSNTAPGVFSDSTFSAALFFAPSRTIELDPRGRHPQSMPPNGVGSWQVGVALIGVVVLAMTLLMTLSDGGTHQVCGVDDGDSCGEHSDWSLRRNGRSHGLTLIRW